MKFSVVIPVKNEAANLALCLESVAACDDVVIVDSASTDETLQIAARYNRPVVEFAWDGRFPKKRNWILRHYTFKHPWVLFLDADERLTSEFLQETAQALATTLHNAFWVCYCNWFMGRLLKHGDPMRKTALLRIGHGEYEMICEESWSELDMEIHEHLVVDGSVGLIGAKLEHHDRRGLHVYFARHNEYSTWEAKRYLGLRGRVGLTRRQRLKYRMLTWPIFPVLYFVASYVMKCGLLDGKAGFYFALGKMFYFYQIQAKIMELKQEQQIQRNVL